MTPKEIAIEYSRREEAAGGIAKVGVDGAREIYLEMSREFGIPVENIRAALIDAWAGGAV